MIKSRMEEAQILFMKTDIKAEKIELQKLLEDEEFRMAYERHTQPLHDEKENEGEEKPAQGR